MWTKFGLKLQINFENLRCGRPGEGVSVITDTPGRGGKGQKRANFSDVLYHYGWPLNTFKQHDLDKT